MLGRGIGWSLRGRSHGKNDARAISRLQETIVL